MLISQEMRERLSETRTNRILYQYVRAGADIPVKVWPMYLVSRKSVTSVVCLVLRLPSQQESRRVTSLETVMRGLSMLSFDLMSASSVP